MGKKVAKRKGRTARRSNRNTKWYPEKGQRVALFGTRVPFLARFSVSEWTGFTIVMIFIVITLIIAL